jgi:AcrR family transcriptional regulator
MGKGRSIGSASGMVATPWGRADSLRERRLPPGPGRRAEEVAQSQRERLFAAMVASVSERGYAATRVSDLVELSGVSSRTFYDLFADKQACFVAAVEAMLGMAIEYAAQTTATGGGNNDGGVSWEERARSDFRAFGEMIAAQPAAARMCLIEAYAAGPEALRPLEGAIAGFEALALHSIKESAERAEMPAEMITAHVGAVLEMARNRLRRGREAELPALMGDAAELMLSYRPPPEPLRLATRSASGAASTESLESPNHAERAIRALAVVASEKGYANTTVDDVVARAGMSASTFYANFSGKEDALLAAIDSAGAQAAAAVIPTFERSQDWPSGIRTGFGSLFGFLATRPALARLMAVEVYAAGPMAMERRVKALAPLGSLIKRGPTTLRPPSPALVLELIAGGIYALVYRQVRDQGPESLPSLAPLCTYITLAPLLGVESACAAANGDGRVRGPIPESLKAIKVLQTIDPRPMSPKEISAHTGIPVEEVKSYLEELQSNKAVHEVAGGFQASNLERHDEAAWEKLGLEERERISRQVGYLILADVDEAVEAHSFDARSDRHLSRLPVRLDRQGWQDLLAAHDALLDATLEIHEKSAERMKESGEEAIDGRSVQTLFEMPPQTGPSKH